MTAAGRGMDRGDGNFSLMIPEKRLKELKSRYSRGGVMRGRDPRGEVVGG